MHPSDEQFVNPIRLNAAAGKHAQFPRIPMTIAFLLLPRFHQLLSRLRLEPLDIVLGEFRMVRWNGLAREFNWAIRLFTGLLRPRKASDPESACKHSGLKCGARWRRRSLSLVLHRASVS